jgi:hypothetical protein
MTGRIAAEDVAHPFFVIPVSERREEDRDP